MDTMTVEREPKTSEKKLVLFYYDSKRQGYNILDFDDDRRVRFEGTARETARVLLGGMLGCLTTHNFHPHTPFVADSVEYHPVLIEISQREALLEHIVGLTPVPLLQHPLGQRVRMSRVL